MSQVSLLAGDVRAMLRSLPAESVHMAVTSPPYFSLRSYGTEPQVWGGDPSCEHRWELQTQPSQVRSEAECPNSPKQKSNKGSTHAGQDGAGYFCRCGAWRGELGLEPTPDLYISHLVEVFVGLKRVLRKDSLFWLNLGDTSHRGQWAMVPARVALAMQADNWLLRSEVIWAKPAPMPESVRNRCTKSHEMLYMFAKSPRYYFDVEAIKEPLAYPKEVSRPRNGRTANGVTGLSLSSTGGQSSGRQKRDVWTISTEPLKDEHYAAFPTKLVEPCVLAGTSERGVCPSCGKP